MYHISQALLLLGSPDSCTYLDTVALRENMELNATDRMPFPCAPFLDALCMLTAAAAAGTTRQTGTSQHLPSA